MIYNEVNKDLKVISDSLEPCPLCKGIAEIIAFHTTLKEIIIDEIGCPKCNLSITRKIHLQTNSNKFFSKRKKSIVNVIQKWNHRTTN